ncbi:unnamed protein product [Rhizophagus irregularis]|nr:unnamed protein product [Rhizophagus irregularis]
MVHFFVSVDEGQKNIISQQVIKIVEEICTFSEIYEAITEGVFGVCNVRVYVGKEDGKWNNLREGLYDDISLMSELELKYIRFIVHTEENNIVQQNQQFERNAFDIMMEHSHKPYFPSIKREDTQRDQLVDLLWYIDPHHNTLAACSLYLPNIFKELSQYQCDSNYNKFYYTSHHKKESLKREKLKQLAESLELSIGQPWASEAKWTDFILEVFELANMINQYAKYLQRVNNKVNVRHTSNMAVRNVSQDLQVYTVERCSEIDTKYQELSYFLSNKNNYEFFNLEEYIPSNPMQRYRYIQNLQLDFPVTIYRYHQGNYLGKEFDIFWNEMEAYFNENMPAVDDQ